MREHKIGDFLKRVKNQVNIEDSKRYKRITIRTNHQGVNLRNETFGAEIGTKNQFIVEGGDFILSKIDARYGAFGIIPEELGGAIITGNFWTYKVDKELVDTEWFFYFTHSYDFLKICKESSTGTTHRKYLNEKIFLNHRIDLPEKDIQVKMVRIYKEGAKRVGTLGDEIHSQKTLVSQLKQSILQEAIQGQLTREWRKENPELISGENSAAVLLENIKAEKALLIKEKKIKKEKLLPPITEEEIPFELPEGWVWCRLGEIGNASNYPFVDGPFGSSIDTKNDYVEKGVPVLRMMNIKPFKFIKDSFKYVKEEKYRQFTRHNVLPGDILFAKVGAGIGEACIVPNDFTYGMLATTGITRMRVGQIVENSYLCSFLNLNISKFMSIARQSSQPFLNMTQVKSFMFPLPSIQEQKVIVAKVEALMKKCSALEQQITQSEQHAQTLMQAVLKEAFEGEEIETIETIERV